VGQSIREKRNGSQSQAGTLKAIYVDEGSQVKKGDQAVELQNLELTNSREEGRGELASYGASLSLLKARAAPVLRKSNAPNLR
jgi:multidrug efflux pump subunit AcrA (membrane-fusion protein)